MAPTDTPDKSLPATVLADLQGLVQAIQEPRSPAQSSAVADAGDTAPQEQTPSPVQSAGATFKNVTSVHSQFASLSKQPAPQQPASQQPASQQPTSQQFVSQQLDSKQPEPQQPEPKQPVAQQAEPSQLTSNPLEPEQPQLEQPTTLGVPGQTASRPTRPQPTRSSWIGAAPLVDAEIAVWSQWIGTESGAVAPPAHIQIDLRRAHAWTQWLHADRRASPFSRHSPARNRERVIDVRDHRSSNARSTSRFVAAGSAFRSGSAGSGRRTATRYSPAAQLAEARVAEPWHESADAEPMVVEQARLLDPMFAEVADVGPSPSTFSEVVEDAQPLVPVVTEIFAADQVAPVVAEIFAGDQTAPATAEPDAVKQLEPVVAEVFADDQSAVAVAEFATDEQTDARRSVAGPDLRRGPVPVATAPAMGAGPVDPLVLDVPQVFSNGAGQMSRVSMASWLRYNATLILAAAFVVIGIVLIVSVLTRG